MSDDPSAPGGDPEIARLKRRNHEIYQRIIDLERKVRATNDRLNILRNSFAVIYGVMIVLVVAAGVWWFK